MEMKTAYRTEETEIMLYFDSGCTAHYMFGIHLF